MKHVVATSNPEEREEQKEWNRFRSHKQLQQQTATKQPPGDWCHKCTELGKSEPDGLKDQRR